MSKDIIQKVIAELEQLCDSLRQLSETRTDTVSERRQKEKLLSFRADDFSELQQKVIELRNCAIRAELSIRIPGFKVAEKYNLSTARVSQIKKAGEKDVLDNSNIVDNSPKKGEPHEQCR